jgi:predicted Zn-dependent protease
VALAGVLARDRGTREGALATAQAGGYMLRLVHLAHRREDELQADRFGATYAAQAGYDPRAMVDVLRILREERLARPRMPVPDWVKTHPSDEERIAQMEAFLAREFPAGSPVPPADTAWASATARFHRLLPAIERYDAARDALGRHDPTRARELLDEAVAAAPDYADARTLRGWLRLRGGDRNGALADFSEAIRLVPDDREARIGAGAALVESGRYAEAVDQLNYALEADPADYRAQFYLGRAYFGQGRFDDAAQKFRLVLELMQEHGGREEPYWSQSQSLLTHIRSRPR